MGEIILSLRGLEVSPQYREAELSFRLTRSGHLSARAIRVGGQVTTDFAELERRLEEIPITFHNRDLDASVPRVFWLVHPTVYAPPDFALGFDYVPSEERSCDQIAVYASSVNSINRLNSMLTHVQSHLDSFIILLESGRTEIDTLFGDEAPVSEVADMIHALEGAGRLWKANGFQKMDDVSQAGRMSRQLGYDIRDCYHVLCGISAPGCVSYAATLLKTGRDIYLDPIPEYANSIFYAPQFTSRSPLTPIYFSTIIEPSSDRPWPYDDMQNLSGFVPRLMF